jgi:ribosomal protein S18 acetylase RimI-like enzyme
VCENRGVGPPLDITLLPTAASADAQLMHEVTDLVNRVYAIAEKGQWLPGTTRTTVDEITRCTRAGQIFVARRDGALAGSIRVQHLDATTGESGMLAVDPAYRNLGIGRELRRFVVEHLRRQGMTTLQIELLVPRDWTQPSKQFMADWNTRFGYQVVRRGSFEDQYPELAPFLATPCDFVIYQMAL